MTDPKQNALAQIRAGLETLREEGMGELGESYVMEALEQMGMVATAAAAVKGITEVVLEQVTIDGVMRMKGTAEVSGVFYPMRDDIALTVKWAAPDIFEPGAGAAEARPGYVLARVINRQPGDE